MTIQLLIDSKFNSAGVKQAEEQVRALARQVEATLSTSSGSTDAFIQQFRGPEAGDVQAIQQEITKLEQLAAAWRAEAIAKSQSLGIPATLMLQKEADAAEQTANSLRRLIGATQESNTAQEKQTSILDLVNNKFSKFAFALFVAQGAVNTMTRIVKQLFTVLAEGAAVADRSAAFSVLIEDAGLASENLAAGLRKASQGAVTLDTSIRPTLQLIKAGVPEVAGASDKLLKMAVASARLSGDLSQTEQIYTTLVRGIVRGSPRLIDNADIYLKLGDANERYAESVGKTVEELTAQEKIIATFRAVEEQGDAMLELAEKVDSSALVFQKFKTDVGDAWNIVSSNIAEGVANSIVAIQQLIVITAGFATQLTHLPKETEAAWIDFVKTFTESPLTTFVSTIVIGFIRLGGVLRGVGAEIKNFFADIGLLFNTVSQQIDVILAKVRGEITTEQARLEINRLSAEYEVGIESADGFTEAMAAADEEARKFAVSVGLIPPSAQDAAQGIAEVDSETKRLSNTFNQLSAGIQAAIEARTGLDAQYRDKRQDIEEGIRDKVSEINSDLSERLVDINNDLRERLTEIGEKYREDVTKLAQDTADKLGEIEEDLAEKLAEASEEAQERRQKAQTDKHKAIEDAQEDHQKKLLDIERKYEARRLKALIDRDARALFEAEQSRKQEQQDANEDLQDKIKEEEEQLEEQMEEIAKLEEKRREDAIKAAEKRRQDALDAQADKLQDLKNSFDKERQEAKESAMEQRQDALQSAQERRRDAQEGYRDALQDLDEWYRDQLIQQKEANLQKKLNELQHLEEMGELTQEHLDELKGMYQDYNDFVSGATGATTPTTGGGGSVGGATPGGGGTTGGGGGTIGGAGNNSGRTTGVLGGNGLMRLQINSNDRTLDDVLKSSTYDYMIEVLDE